MCNDMMNVSHQVQEKVVRSELRKVIRGVLSDIYFAHIATLFMENLIGSELKGIAREAILS